jgi:hypothetical protein
MSDPIDYSRPVGWWCPVCQLRETSQRYDAHRFWLCLSGVIPVYLPLPTPEPVEVDEVETGEAEVVTVGNGRGSWAVWSTNFDGDLPDAADWRDDVDVINRIAQASANARKKREEAK